MSNEKVMCKRRYTMGLHLKFKTWGKKWSGWSQGNGYLWEQVSGRNPGGGGETFFFFFSFLLFCKRLSYFYFFMVRTLNIRSTILTHFYMYNILFIICTILVQQISRAYSSCLIETLCLLIIITHFPHSPSYRNHHSTLWFYEFNHF